MISDENHGCSFITRPRYLYLSRGPEIITWSLYKNKIAEIFKKNISQNSTQLVQIPILSAYISAYKSRLTF